MTLLLVHSSCLGYASNFPTVILFKCWIYFEQHLRWEREYFQVVFWVSSFWFASLPAQFSGLVKVITASLSWMFLVTLLVKPSCLFEAERLLLRTAIIWFTIMQIVLSVAWLPLDALNYLVEVVLFVSNCFEAGVGVLAGSGRWLGVACLAVYYCWFLAMNV